MSLGFVLLVILIAMFLILIWDRRNTYWLHFKLKTDLWTFPIIGHGHLFIGTDEDRMNGFKLIGKAAMKYGGLTKLCIGTRLFVVVLGPKDLEIVLKSCLDKDDIMNVAREVVGNGSIFAPVPVWRPRRKVVASIFSPKNLSEFANVFSKHSCTTVDRLRDKSDERPFSVFSYLTSYSMDSVCENTLGINVGAQNKSNNTFLEAFQEHCELASFRVCQHPVVQEIYKYMPIYQTYLRTIKIMHQFIDEIVQKKRKEIEDARIKSVNNDGSSSQTKTKTFLELYMESSKGGFTNLELREEALVLVLAGSDTSAVGAAFTCLMLSMHPEVQERAFEEIRDIFGDSDRPVTSEDLSRLRYLDIVVKESLRLYPPAPVIVRKVDTPVTLTNGLLLHKGTSLFINIWAIHRNPQYWGEDADVFRPERFIDACPEHPMTFIPFSGGPRSCPGYQYAMMSMKTGICSILRNYKILPVDPSREKHTELRVKFDVMLKDVNNFEVKLQARSKN